MLLPITLYGSPILRKVSEDINPDYPGLEKLIEDMFETMYQADGLGLAAPQIGRNIRLIVIDARVMEDDHPELAEFKVVLINPHILETGGEKWIFNEGCLSVPGVREDVERVSEIEIEYLDEHFQQHREKFDGIKARIIMHEYDHLEGVLFVDRIPLLRKKIIRGRLNNIARGKVDYPVKKRS